MRTIMIDGSMYSSSQDLHAAVKKLLFLPEYYGMNADALNDCLSDRLDTVNLWIYHPGQGNVADTLQLIADVIRDNGGTVKGVDQVS